MSENTAIKNEPDFDDQSLQEKKQPETEKTKVGTEKKAAEAAKEEKGTNEKEKEEKKETRKKKHLRWILLILGITLVFIAGGYCYAAYYYTTHFFRNTFINDIDCSNKTAVEIADFLDSKALDYSIEIIGRNEKGEKVTLGVIEASDMDYSFQNTLEGVSAVLNSQDQWLWITTLGSDTRSYSLVQGITYDAERLAHALESLEAFQIKNMISPVDARISEYSEDLGGYEIIPETLGTKLDVKAAIACVEAAIAGDSASENAQVDLVEQGCYEEPEKTADDKTLKKSVDTINQWLETEIVYDWNGEEVIVDKDVIKEWVSFEDDQPVLDEEAVVDFVNENASDHDTFGKKTTFTTALGIEVSLKRLSYGWKTDSEGEAKALTELIYDGAKQEREPLYTRKGVWKGQNDIGNSYIEADLTYQHLYVYENGSIVFETDFVSGNVNKPGCTTPAGIFGLTYKTTNAVLRGEDYETPVNYWMPFYGNFGMHDATWRRAFGGEIYLTNGSHGCINLPLDAAALIYTYVSEGSPIICYYY